MSRSSDQAELDGALPGSAGRELAHLERLGRVLDAKFRLPGTRFRFGWDPIVGILPGVGDAVMLGPGLYILFRARRSGVPTGIQLRMVGNLLVDWLIGTIPLIGVVFDAGYKANLRNIRLFRGALLAKDAGAAATRDPAGRGPGRGL